MNNYIFRAESSEEKERQRAFEKEALYGTDLAPETAKDIAIDDVRFEAETYVVMKDLRVVFK